MACPHPSFAADVVITRIEEAAGAAADDTRFVAEIRVACTACQVPFRFLGLPAGFDLAAPRVSIAADTLLAPIEPADTLVLAEHATYVVPGASPQPH